MNITSLILMQKVKAAAGTAWSVASVCCVAGTASLSLYWGFGPGGSNAVLANKNPPTIKAEGGQAELNSAISLDTGNRRLVYRMTLENDKHEVVHSYPAIEQQEGMPAPDLGNMTIAVPPNVEAGDYQLFADVAYEINPLKANKLRVELARIKVEKE